MNKIKNCPVCKNVKKFDTTKFDFSEPEPWEFPLFMTNKDLRYQYDSMGLRGIMCTKCYNFWRREGDFNLNV